MKQSTALGILKTGRNVFLTGSAGAGKTYVLNQYIQYLKERKVPVAITASTGIAATHMNGMTIHSWSGMGIKDQIAGKDLLNLKTKKHIVKKMEDVKVLIVDEISMLHKDQLDNLNLILKFFKEDTAFGGIQLVLSGDFFQLPPVGRPGEKNRDKFAFMSDAWVEANLAICYLSEQHRQEDNSLNQILNSIRSATVKEETAQQLMDASVELEESDSFTRLYTHNADVDRINQEYLDQLDGRPRPFKAKKKGNPKLIEMLSKSVLTEETLYLKKEAKVMFVKNNFELGFVNGTMGKVTGFTDAGFPMVKTRDKTLEVKQETWAVEDEQGKVLASYMQLPLRLAWAITVHKSQGMTLDKAEIDLSHTFERGQGYVALSRLKDLEGLSLLGINNTALEVDSLALKADQRFQELSTEAEQEHQNSTDLEALHKQFLFKTGGLISKEAIEKHKKEKAEKIKRKKTPTHLLTKELLDKGKSIQEIAKDRALTTSTIVKHFFKIKELYPNTDFSFLKPEEDTFSKVEKASQALLKKAGLESVSSLSKSAIFDHLDGKISYADINKSLLLMD